jgi:integrase
LTTPTETPRPALVEAVAVAKLMTDIAAYSERDLGYGGRGWKPDARMCTVVSYALQFLALTVARPGNVAEAEWSEFGDLDAAKWVIPAAKMKMRKAHEVPLSRQAVAILREVAKLTGERRYVFSITEDQPLFSNAMNRALRRLGYDTNTEHCAHGFRSTFSTLLNDEHDKEGLPVWNPYAIEMQLAHDDEDGVRGKYNRAALWLVRVKLMQHWADRIDLMRSGAQVIVMPQLKAHAL